LSGVFLVFFWCFLVFSGVFWCFLVFFWCFSGVFLVFSGVFLVFSGVFWARPAASLYGQRGSGLYSCLLLRVRIVPRRVPNGACKMKARMSAVAKN
jgi:hypothetical protein